jgi:N-acetylmuramoyl-L-alanine amidase
MQLFRINSPNFNKNLRVKSNIKFLIIHYTGMQSKRASLERLVSIKHKVSCHYLVDRNGKVFQFVSDNRISWHAGKSKWKNFKNLNNKSIGIELVNKGHSFGYEKFSKKQIDKLSILCLLLKKKYRINNSCILGHSDIAPLRKIDPGEKFPWKKLSKKGVGLWYFNEKKNFENLKKTEIRNIFFKNLHKIGYRYFNKNKSSSSDSTIVKAFQRRYVQHKVNGKIDLKMLKISHYLAKKS